MGNSKTPNEPGYKPPGNGHGGVYSPASWRDYVLNKRPTNVKRKRAVIIFSIEFILFGYIVLDILKGLTEAKEIIALIVAICWLGARAVMVTMKGLSFWGKHHESIKRGIKSLKDLFKE